MPKIAASSRFARDTIMEIMDKAIDEGVCDEARFMSMTPNDLKRAYARRDAAETRVMRIVDFACWLIGQYVAVAIYSPKSYPHKPSCVRGDAMTDDEMKGVMKAIAMKQ